MFCNCSDNSNSSACVGLTLQRTINKHNTRHTNVTLHVGQETGSDSFCSSLYTLLLVLYVRVESCGGIQVLIKPLLLSTAGVCLPFVAELQNKQAVAFALYGTKY